MAGFGMSSVDGLGCSTTVLQSCWTSHFCLLCEDLCYTEVC